MVTEAVPMQLPPRRRRWPYYVVGLVVLAILWVGYWYGASTFANIALNRVTSLPFGGYSIACTSRNVSGFPLRVDVRCERPTVTDPNTNGAVGGVFASVPLYWPTTINAVLDSPLQVNAAAHGLAVTAAWSFASASASVWLDGLSGGSAHFDGLAFQNAGRPDALPVTAATASAADVSLAPIGSGNYRAHIDAKDLAVRRSDGGPFPTVDLAATMDANGVGALGTDPVAALTRWLKAGGGTLKIDDVRLAAGGAIVTASGTLTLSKEGKLNGSVLFGFNSIDALGKLIEMIRPGTVTNDKGKLALQTINALSRQISTPDGQLQQTSFTFTDGLIWLAIFPLPIDPIPPIKF